MLLMLLSVLCCVEREKNVYNPTLFEPSLYLPYKNVYKTREISVAPLVCFVRPGVYLV